MSEKVRARTERVLEAAIELALEAGFAGVTRNGTARRAGVAMGTVNNSFATLPDLKAAVMAAAVERGIKAIIAGGLAEGHPVARAAPQALKDSALASLAA